MKNLCDLGRLTVCELRNFQSLKIEMHGGNFKVCETNVGLHGLMFKRENFRFTIWTEGFRAQEMQSQIVKFKTGKSKFRIVYRSTGYLLEWSSRHTMPSITKGVFCRMQHIFRIIRRAQSKCCGGRQGAVVQP